MAKRTYGISGRNQRRLGRHGPIMRSDDRSDGESGGGGQQGGGNDGGNNGGGNSGGENNSGGNQNNTGPSFDPSSFWKEPAPEGGQSPQNRGSADGNQSGAGQENHGDAFAKRLDTMTFATSVFTPEAIQAMNEQGDSKAFNDNMTTFGRQAVRESVVMAAQLMQKNNDMMEARFGEMLNERFGQRDSESDLGSSFPSYKQPGMKPIIDGIFAQSMRLSKGDRQGAIAMTKEMLKHQATLLNGDLGITTPPGGAGDGHGTQTNWEEELLGRRG